MSSEEFASALVEADDVDQFAPAFAEQPQGEAGASFDEVVRARILEAPH